MPLCRTRILHASLLHTVEDARSVNFVFAARKVRLTSFYGAKLRSHSDSCWFNRLVFKSKSLTRARYAGGAMPSVALTRIHSAVPAGASLLKREFGKRAIRRPPSRMQSHASLYPHSSKAS